MKPEEIITNKLNAARMMGDVNFTDIEVEYQSGNKYINVVCTDIRDRDRVRNLLEDQLESDSRLSDLDGPKVMNPGTDESKVYVLKHNVQTADN